MNPTETFQNAIVDAVKVASEADVHPAIVFTVLHGVAGDVMYSIKRANQQAQPPSPNVTPLPTTQPGN